MPLSVGDAVELDGAPWRVVDLAPAYALAEMAAEVLAEAGHEVAVFAVDAETGRLGPPTDREGVGAAVVLVPEAETEPALAHLEAEITDYSGDDLDELMALMQASESNGDESDERASNDGEAAGSDDGPSGGRKPDES